MSFFHFRMDLILVQEDLLLRVKPKLVKWFGLILVKQLYWKQLLLMVMAKQRCNRQATSFPLS